MKVAFAALRGDPRRGEAVSGAEFQFYAALERRGIELVLVAPPSPAVPLWERAASRLYRAATGAGYLKYRWSVVRRASRLLEGAVRDERPDVVLTLFPAALVHYSGAAPCVYRLDTTFRQLAREGPEFLSAGRLALRISLWQERRALARSARVITHSARSRDELVAGYGVAPEKIEVFPNPSPLAPAADEPEGRVHGLEPPLRLLLIGRDRRRKGVDVAIEVVRELEHLGIPARLTICGLAGEDDAQVRYTGFLDRSDSAQLETYLGCYRDAHFLLHPARFDPSPRAIAEAAAFGVPALTNDNGGLATQVADGESGMVLPRGSRSEAYVGAILGLMRRPQDYLELRRGARRRYLEELNWDVASRRLVAVLERAAGNAHR